MRVLSPAKINLHLRVGPKQSDGFHPLVTWMVTVGLFDTLDFTLDTAGRVHLSCTDPSLPVDERNLIVRAARLLQTEPTKSCGGEKSVPDAEAGRRVEASEAAAFESRPNEPGQPGSDATSRGVAIHLTKRIPMGGGLGGGSSNAAYTLMALNDLWGLHLPRERLSEYAARLGSDVPFFIEGSSSICTGRGEITSRVNPPAARWVVLMLPGLSDGSKDASVSPLSMPTPPVYRQFDAMFSGEALQGWDEPVEWVRQRNLSAEDLLQLLRNDLEPPAFVLAPELSRLRQTAEALVARPVRMSGSGASLFTLFDDRGLAENAAFVIHRELKVPSMAVPIAPQSPFVAPGVGEAGK